MITPSGRRHRIAVAVTLAGLSMLGPFTIDTVFPAFVSIQHDFGVGSDATQQLVSGYLLAFGLMSVFHGPISDAIGRRPVMLGGLLVYAAASALCLVAWSMPVLLVGRVLQGFAAGGGVIISRTVVRDLYDGAEAQRLMSRIMMIFGLAPALAPIIGGWLLVLGSWRVIFLFVTGYALLMATVMMLVLPETHPRERRTPLQVKALLGGLATVTRSAGFHRIAWSGAFMFGGWFLYIGAAAIVVVDLLGGGDQDFWWLFLPLIVGMITGSWLSSRAAGRMSAERLITIAVTVALVAAIVGVAIVLLPGGRVMPWPVVGPMLLGVGVGMGYPNLQLAALDLFPDSRGATSSATTFLALFLNALGAGVLAPLVTRSLVTLASTAAAYEVVALLLWRWHLRATGRTTAAPTPGHDLGPISLSRTATPGRVETDTVRRPERRHGTSMRSRASVHQPRISSEALTNCQRG